MRLCYKGEYDEAQSYIPGSVVRLPAGNHKVRTYDGQWADVAAPPDSSCRGPKGDKGDPGASIKGDKGDPGESIKGDKGDPGPRGKRGPRGREGAQYFSSVTKRITEAVAGGGSSPQVAAIFDSAAIAGYAVYVPSSGHVDLADAGDFATAGVAGICAGDVEAGNAGIIQSGGTITRDDWTAVVGSSTLAPGNVYYLALTPGQITNVAPTGGGECVTVVGRALSATELSVEIAPPILLEIAPDDP
jgi:hypothetical protein